MLVSYCARSLSPGVLRMEQSLVRGWGRHRHHQAWEFTTWLPAFRLSWLRHLWGFSSFKPSCYQLLGNGFRLADVSPRFHEEIKEF